MPELLLYYIWQHRLWALYNQYTTDGRPIEIISIGQRNVVSGPDFTNVHLKIDGRDWIGNVEMHIHSSDWYRHKHHTDSAYDNIILHIVNHADKAVYNSKNEPILQCELRFPKDRDYLSQLLSSYSSCPDIACSEWLKMHADILTMGWKKALLTARLECKRKSIDELLKRTANDWNSAFYITLAHNFGFHTNGIAFESLALATPLPYLLKHRDNLFQLTAILLGQSGLLSQLSATNDEYLALWNEYLFLRKKFQLSSIDANLWKTGGLRPQNSPILRIRQFAMLLYQSEFLFSRLMVTHKIEEMMDLFKFSPRTEQSDTFISYPSPLGTNAIQILLMNTVFPYQYAYALFQKDSISTEMVIGYYEELNAEDNHIIRQWKSLGQPIKTGADTQALIHLYQNYCQPHDCIHCEVGHVVFLRPSPCTRQ